MKLKSEKVRIQSRFKKKTMVLWGLSFALIGVATIFITRAATPVTIDSSLPNPTNIGAYGDDRVATVWWAAPADGAAKGIVGYYVTYGEAGTGVYTNAKQTTNRIIQLQPLENGKTYIVKVQAVHGSTVSVPTPGAWSGSTGQEVRADGKVSTGITITVSPTSTRVDKLRADMTGFFDDFNTPAGAFDELKWNQAVAACVAPATAGAFINNQYHSHNQVRSINDGNGLVYCDRAQMVSRPRATFDITGRTEANPGVIVGDFDGATIRDTWYIDLVPLDARSNKIPLDITGHADVSHDEVADPAMIRFAQGESTMNIFYSDNASKQNRTANKTYVACPDFKGDMDFSYYGGGDGGWCGGPVRSGNNIPVMWSGPWTRYFPSPNVRMQYRLEISPTKIKVFLNDVRMLEATMPADFANVKQYTVQSTLFSYNTGKDSNKNSNTSLLHWDNFGFNGPAPTTVVHNYQDGQTDGASPILGTGNVANSYMSGGGSRLSKINIPDQIGTPKEARLMFTVNCLGNSGWQWNSSQHVLINSKRYDIPSTASLQKPPLFTEGDAGHYIPYALGFPISVADLKQGINDVKFNLSSCDVLNVHIELEYNKGTEPAYTQPVNVFGATKFLAAVQPVMSSHDSYLFVEQNMGLPSGVIAEAPGSGGSDTQKPTVSIVSPPNNTSFSQGNQLPLIITAEDNVGIDKVEVWVDGSRNTTITHSPFNHSLDTTGWTTGSHKIYAVAFDAAANSTKSTEISVNITPATSFKPGDLNSDGMVTILDLSIVIGNWSKTNASRAQGDANGDGTVNIFDLSIVITNWGK